MAKHWLLVANASVAALFENESEVWRELHALRRFSHDQSRAKNRELTTDINGRKPGGGIGPDGRPGAEPDTMPKEVEHERFARELAGELASGLARHAYERVAISAPPHFLGLLRSSLSTEVQKHVELTINKDLTQLDDRAVAEAVRTEAQAATH